MNDDAVIERLTAIETMLKSMKAELDEIKSSLNHTVAHREWVEDQIALRTAEVEKQLVEERAARQALEARVKRWAGVGTTVLLLILGPIIAAVLKLILA